MLTVCPLLNICVPFDVAQVAGKYAGIFLEMRMCVEVEYEGLRLARNYLPFKLILKNLDDTGINVNMISTEKGKPEMFIKRLRVRLKDSREQECANVQL